MKTILLTSFHNFTARNILVAPFLKLLTEKADVRVVILVPEGKVSFYEKEFGGENIAVEGVSGRLRRVDTIFKGFAFAAMRTKSANLMRKVNIGVEHEHPLQKFFFWAPLFRCMVPRLYALIMPKNAYADLFEKYTPSLLFATDAFSAVDNRLLHEARIRGIKTVSMVRSWDNLTTKGILRVLPDILVVNNDILKKEAIQLHRVPEDRIAVVGIPFHDRYMGGPKHSRKEFITSISGRLDKKLIVYAALGDPLFPGHNYFDVAIIDLLVKAIPETQQLLVRLPPAMGVMLDGLESRDKILLERPGVQQGSNPNNVSKTELGIADDDHLIDTLFYADVFIAVTTTMLLDATLCDRPTIVIDFDFREGKWSKDAPSELLYYSHMQPLLKSGGVRIVQSPAELSRAIQEYIQNPSKDHEGRMRTRSEIAHIYDGHASELLLWVIRDALL